MNIPVKNCSSCMACVNVCARGAIEIVQDDEGFYRPNINEDLCVQCGTCEKACPWETLVKNPNGSSAAPRTLAAFNNDESVRLQSSSGGVFSILAKSILCQGGVVVGVGYKDPTHLEFKFVQIEEELEELRLSKYFQANAGDVYRQVKKMLLDGRKVLFSGTSCQVAALYAVLGKRKFENLTTVDIVCHGVPSPKVFEKYVGEVEQKNSAKVASSNFRDKVSGWKRYSITNKLVIEYRSGSDFLKKSSLIREDDFMVAFLDNLCLNSSCANCKYAKVPRIADITLGDYWGVAKYHPEMDDDKGTSVVLLNTAHGENVFNVALDTPENQTMTICESHLEYAVAGNPCIVRSSRPHKNRDAFMAALDTASLSQLLKKYNPPPSFTHRLIGKIWCVVKKIAKKALKR